MVPLLRGCSPALGRPRARRGLPKPALGSCTTGSRAKSYSEQPRSWPRRSRRLSVRSRGKRARPKTPHTGAKPSWHRARGSWEPGTLPSVPCHIATLCPNTSARVIKFSIRQEKAPGAAARHSARGLEPPCPGYGILGLGGPDPTKSGSNAHGVWEVQRHFQPQLRPKFCSQ